MLSGIIAIWIQELLLFGFFVVLQTKSTTHCSKVLKIYPYHQITSVYLFVMLMSLNVAVNFPNCFHHFALSVNYI